MQIHGRNAVLKELSSQTSLPKKLQVYQMYPLSYEDADATDRTATIDDFVSDVEQVRLYTGAPTATIVGHSMGAAVALQYAIRALVSDCCFYRGSFASSAASLIGRVLTANTLAV